MAKKLTAKKARKILHDKSVHGHPLTKQQRKFFGAIAGGAKPYKAEDGGWLDKYEAQDGITTKERNNVLNYLQSLKEPQPQPTKKDLQSTISKSKPLVATNTREAYEAKRKEKYAPLWEAEEKEAQRLKEERATAAKTREQVIGGDENATFTFPTGETKKWKDMDFREQQYVVGRNMGSWNNNNWTDWINPIAMLGGMGEGLATAPYEARRQDSVLPYVFGVGAPLLTGTLAGIGAKNVGQFAENIISPLPVSASDITSNVKKAAQSWQVKELPGLHLKSTMSEGPISKIVEPKTGLVNVEQALGIIGKESGGKEKVSIVKKALGDAPPKKMDYNEFRKTVQDQLVPLNKTITSHRSDYGLTRIGYDLRNKEELERSLTFENAQMANEIDKVKELESYLKDPNKYEKYKTETYGSNSWSKSDKEFVDEIQRAIERYSRAVKDRELEVGRIKNNLKYDVGRPVENQTIILSNESGFGKGSSAHNNPEETLGHIHFVVDKESPNTLTVTQIQSDAFQGKHRTMPKSKEEAMFSLTKQEEHAKALDDLYSKAKPRVGNDGTVDLDFMGRPFFYELPNGQVVTREIFESTVPSQLKINELTRAEVENFEQKSLLDKSHQERYLQEIMSYAGERGMNKLRLPTSETAAKVQNYKPLTTSDKVIEKYNELKDTPEWEKIMKESPDADKVRVEKILKGELKGNIYEEEYETILKKYREQPKNIKKLFGVDPKLVTDNKGNTWYEIDIPKSFKEGKGEIKAFEQGGWLDKYEEGGVLKQKTKDNYGTKPNPNEVDATFPPGFVGMGNNLQGRNYSPAWGGQFQNGGWVNTPYTREYTDALRNQWIKFYNPISPVIPPENDDRFDAFYYSERAKVPKVKRTFPAWVKYDDNGDYDYTEGSKDKPPTKYGKPISGYKFVENFTTIEDPDTDELARLVSNIRNVEQAKPHPFRSVNFPLEKYQMGGSLPGAVGFMYARTAGAAPSNGPYAKKTKASAQNGQEMKFYQEGLDFTPKTISQNGRNITTDINDYNRWKDSVNNYIRGQKDLAKARKDIKKNIDSFSLMSGEGIVGAFSNLIQGDIQGKRRFLPKYKEQSLPKQFWMAEKNYPQVPKDVIVVGDPAFDTSAKIKGLTKSLDENKSLTKTNLFPYSGVVEIYHPPVRKNLQYVKPSKPVPKKPVQPVILQEEPKLERPIPIPRETRDLGFSLPTPGAPSFPKLSEYNPDTPTKYSFTYPTGKYNEQKTIYFPTRSAWKSFTEGVRGASSQEGVDYGTSTGNYQDGGNVDPMGYWNPENWGNPVIIPSTDITMEGVDVPLIGISDTGDVQYMEPGENYEFDGEYVTEYPVAQGGRTVPQATTADSLRVYNNAMQLKSFYDKLLPYYGRVETVSSDRTGWLRDLESGKIQKETLEHPDVTARNKAFIRANKDPNVSYLSDIITGAIDPAAPLAIYDKRIKPQGVISYRPFTAMSWMFDKAGDNKNSPTFSNDIELISAYIGGYRSKGRTVSRQEALKAMSKYGFDEKTLRSLEEKEDEASRHLPGYATSIPYYDPIAIKPTSMLTPEEKKQRNRKYPPLTTKPKPPTTPPQSQPEREPELPKFKKRGPLMEVEKKDLSYKLPQPKAPTLLKQSDERSQKPTKYSFTYPTGKYLEDKTIYFPNRSEWKSFVEKVRGARTEEGSDYGSATGTLKNGGNINDLDAQPIKKLDQLLNFTNYNKPTKGGWLDKYN